MYLNLRKMKSDGQRPMNSYDYENIEMIKHAGLNKTLEYTLLAMFETENKKVSLDRALFQTIFKLDEMLQEVSEKLVYAESNRTYSKDILVVGGSKVFIDDEPIGITIPQCEDRNYEV